MLQKIREKSQGIFAWVVLVLICVTFALFGIQNYLGGGSEAPVATVGDKDFYERDVNKAYAQFTQSLSGINFDENAARKQAFDKLIRDEVLLQHVRREGFRASDSVAREFIKEFEYFQSDGEFDKDKYKALLAAQGMSSAQFVERIKQAIIMDQFQKAITETSFATDKDLESFFAIQNQQRNIRYVKIPLTEIQEKPDETELKSYYQQHQDEFLTEEQVAIDYIELSLNDLAADVAVDDDLLKQYYQEQKELYTTKERRKISHILFAFSDKESEAETLKRAQQAKQKLSQTDFATLAQEVSDDSLSAKNGGDLGLFNAGDMDPGFDEVATGLALNEVSEPVKTSFGYHLITVTELQPSEVKPFDAVKKELTEAYKKAQAENVFYELNEQMSDLSFENSSSLKPVADELGLPIKQSAFFSRDEGTDIAAQPMVRQAAFSEDVLQGNNSEIIEIASDQMVVLRVREHKPSKVLEFAEVEQSIAATLNQQKASQLALESAENIRSALSQGESMQSIADQRGLELQSLDGLTRTSQALSRPVIQEVFKAPKPDAENPTIFTVAAADGGQYVVQLLQVTDGVMSAEEKQRQALAERNIADAIGRGTLNAVMAGLERKADISIRSNR